MDPVNRSEVEDREESDPQASHQGNEQWPPLRSHLVGELPQVPTRGGAGGWGVGEGFHFPQSEVPEQSLGTNQLVSILLFS